MIYRPHFQASGETHAYCTSHIGPIIIATEAVKDTQPFRSLAFEYQHCQPVTIGQSYL
jgi:hypothetical protein